ncbi:MAG: hypothetical protein ACR2O5_06215 [Thiogranum sp.]
MTESLRETVHKQHNALCVLFHAPLRSIARRAVRVWFNRGRLDGVLSEVIRECFQCDLLYAIDTDGRQVSSNIHERSIDPGSYGQDLSLRPYLISMPLVGNAAFQGPFLCDVYTSQVTRRPCVTVMCGVTSGPTTLGFIAADLDPHQLLPLKTARPTTQLTADLR